MHRERIFAPFLQQNIFSRVWPSQRKNCYMTSLFHYLPALWRDLPQHHQILSGLWKGRELVLYLEVKFTSTHLWFKILSFQ